MAVLHDDNLVSHIESTVCVGAGVLGSLLLTVLGCMLFQFCKNKQRKSASPSKQRRAASTVSSDKLQADNDHHDHLLEAGGQQNPVSIESGEGEHRYLTASTETAQVVRYCLLHDSPASPLAGTDNAKNCEGETDSADTTGVDGVTAEESVNTVDITQGGGNRADMVTTITYNEACGFHSHKTREQTNSGEGKVPEAQTPQSDLRQYENQVSATMANRDACSQADTASDMSEYLATIGLDVSSEHSDVTGDWTQTSSSRATDDSVQSLESFSHLQEVKAQADFSPYHIAWSTPRCLPHPSLNPCASRTRSAAKKLNLDGVSGQPCDPIPETVSEHSQSVPDATDSTKRDSSQSSEESANIVYVGSHGWGFLKPRNVCNRPVSVDYRTPRPLLIKKKHRNVETWMATDQEIADQEQPLLAYSVSEYRNSLKNVAKVGSTEHSTEGTSLTQSYPGSYLSPPFSILPTEVFGSELDTRRMPLSIAHVSPVYSSQNEEDTLLNLTSSLAVNMDSTLAGFPDITHSSIEDCSAASGQNKSATKASEDAQNNNKEIAYGLETSQSSAESSLQSSTTSPSCLHSSETDKFSSDASQEKMHTGSNINERIDIENRLALSSSSSGSMSPRLQPVDTMGSFKVPYPMRSAEFKTTTICSFKKRVDKTSLTRSKSSMGKLVTQGTQLAPSYRKLYRSRTTESISSSTLSLHQPMSLGSSSDVSLAGSTASRQSLQNPSLTWENEFAFSDIAHDDSLTWEDDPYLK